MLSYLMKKVNKDFQARVSITDVYLANSCSLILSPRLWLGRPRTLSMVKMTPLLAILTPIISAREPLISTKDLCDSTFLQK